MLDQQDVRVLEALQSRVNLTLDRASGLRELTTAEHHILLACLDTLQSIEKDDPAT